MRCHTPLLNLAAGGEAGAPVRCLRQPYPPVSGMPTLPFRAISTGADASIKRISIDRNRLSLSYRRWFVDLWAGQLKSQGAMRGRYLKNAPPRQTPAPSERPCFVQGASIFIRFHSEQACRVTARIAFLLVGRVAVAEPWSTGCCSQISWSVPSTTRRRPAPDAESLRCEHHGGRNKADSSIPGLFQRDIRIVFCGDTKQAWSRRLERDSRRHAPR